MNNKNDSDTFKAYAEKICATQESARQYLVDLGTHTKWGKIHENYGGPNPEIPLMPDK